MIRFADCDHMPKKNILRHLQIRVLPQGLLHFGVDRLLVLHPDDLEGEFAQARSLLSVGSLGAIHDRLLHHSFAEKLERLVGQLFLLIVHTL